VKLRELEKRRAELLDFCADNDREAAKCRERGEALPLSVRMGFSALSELRAVEHDIAKLKERK